MATEKQRNAIKKLAANQKAKAAFQTEEEFLTVFEQYVDHVTDEKDDKCIVPSYRNFAKWLGDFSSTSVYRYLDLHPKVEKLASQLVADAIVEGAMVAKYRDVPAIFTLKNRCGWTDKRETSSITKQSPDIATADEARRNVNLIMKSLGYDDRGREIKKNGAKQNLEAVEGRIIELAEAKG